MPTAEEQQNERAVFDDEDDDDTEPDDSDDDVSDDDHHHHQNPNPISVADPSSTSLQPSPPPAFAVSGAPPTTSDPSLSNPSPLSAPLNGAPNAMTTVVVATAAVPLEDRRPLAFSAYDESRRLFQRLWTDDDEIKILQGFFEFTSKRGTTFASHQYDTGPFYEDIKKQLNLEFTKNQLIEKLRRLKKKYRNCVSRMRSLGKDFSFKSAHERATYDIARNIWSANVKRARDSDDDELNVAGSANANDVVNVPINDTALSADRKATGSRKRMRRRMAEDAAVASAAAVSVAATAAPATTGVAVGAVPPENSVPTMHTPLQSVAVVPNVIEETVKSCLSPLFKELISSAISSPFNSTSGVGGVASLNMLPLSISSIPVLNSGAPTDEKWKKQQILELEVFLKRTELVRDHIKATLEELRSS